MGGEVVNEYDKQVLTAKGYTVRLKIQPKGCPFQQGSFKCRMDK